MQVLAGTALQSWARGSCPAHPDGSARIWNLGRKSFCLCTQPQALSIFLYLTNCSSEPELFRADSSDSSLEQGGHRHRWWLQFPPAQAQPCPHGGLAGQLAQFVKQAGGREVEHTVLGTQRGWNQPLSSWCPQKRAAATLPRQGTEPSLDWADYLWCHPLAWLK